jgi:hypothetical protein
VLAYICDWQGVGARDCLPSALLTRPLCVVVTGCAQRSAAVSARLRPTLGFSQRSGVPSPWLC